MTPPPRLALWSGAVAVVLVLGGLALKLGGPSGANVPRGIAGLKLGSTLEEARRVMPDLAEATPKPFASPPRPHAYPEYRARALLFDEPATCTVELAVNGRLSRVECVLDTPSEEHEARARAKLLATLRELYGKESQTREGSWLWQNDQARLLLVSAPDLKSLPQTRATTLRLSNWSKADEKAKTLIESQR